MESIVLAFLFIVVGGGVLLVALIFAAVTGSARSERLQRLEQEQASLEMDHAAALARIARLERGMGEAMEKLAFVHAEQGTLTARLALGGREDIVAPEREPVAAPTPALSEVAVQDPPPLPAEPVPDQVFAVGPMPEAVIPVTLLAEVLASDLASAEAAVSQHTAEPEIAVAPLADPAIPPTSNVARPRKSNRRAPAPEPVAEPALVPARFDWERWVGVRGAAALGACVLVIAGLYFFKYSLENDLISPAMRVVLGVLAGLGALGVSENRLRRDNPVLANWLAGAGVAILYTAFWFVHHFGLIPTVASFGLMALVTVACGLLAVRHDAMPIAVLGLMGGFATPAALSTGEDHPFGLFGYLLMLDGALLYLAGRRRWPLLGALSLAGTALYQAAWISDRMGPERLALGMGILVVFAALFAVAAPAGRAEDEGGLWGLTRAATVLLPFGFGLYFGVRADLGEHVYPLGAMLAIVSAGAVWIGRVRAVPWASMAAAIASTTVVGVWLFVHPHAEIAWEAALVPAGLAAVFHVFVELDVRRPDPSSSPSLARAAAVSSLGTLCCLFAAASSPANADPWPWLAGWAVLGAIVLRQSSFPGHGAMRLGLALVVDAGFVVMVEAHAGTLGYPAQAVALVGLAADTVLGLVSAAIAVRSAGDRALADEIAALLPFVTVLALVSHGRLGDHLAPLAISITALAAGAAWVAHWKPAASWTAPASAFAGFMVVAEWLWQGAHAEMAWASAAFVCAVGAVLPASVVVARWRGRETAPDVGRWAALAPIGGMILLAAAGASTASPPWPWLAGWTLLAVVALAGARAPGREPLSVVVAVVLGVAFPLVAATQGASPLFPAAPVWMAAGLVTALAFLGFAARRGAVDRWAGHAAATLSLILLVTSPLGGSFPAPLFFYAHTLALLAVTLLVAGRLGAGGWTMAGALGTALVHTIASFAVSQGSAEDARASLVASGLAVALVAAWPLLAGPKLRESLWAWRAAALSAPLWFLALEHAFRIVAPGSAGLVALALGAVTLTVAWRARPVLPEALRRSALVWLLGTTVGAATLAIPLQLENEWITIGWALEGLALLAIWRRLDHAGLKYVAIAHLGVSALRLTLNPAVLGYHPRSDVPILNWLAYTYWIPAAALLAGWILLRDREVGRSRPWEEGLYARGRAVLSMSLGAAAVGVLFVWINLAIFDAFGTGPQLEIVLARLPARDLTLSLAWALYALALLGAGMVRRSAALRWVSLSALIATIGKVFLYDLSHLHDLYRVMSLVGLALSLILVSALYQRFVFGRRAAAVG